MKQVTLTMSGPWPSSGKDRMVLCESGNRVGECRQDASRKHSGTLFAYNGKGAAFRLTPSGYSCAGVVLAADSEVTRHSLEIHQQVQNRNTMRLGLQQQMTPAEISGV